jgi:hypothetical protein
MPGATLDISLTCGRDFYLSITNQTVAGNAWDMRNYLTVMTVKAHINDPDSKALFQSGPEASDLAFGKLSFQIPHAVSAHWWIAPPSGSGAVSTVCVYDVAYADNASPTRNWNTMLSGAVNLQQPVTITIPGG